MKIFITYICVLSLSLFSCGDSRRLGSERKGGIGENCTKTDDCENPLKCLNKVCSKSGSIGGTDGPVGPGNNSTGTGTGAEPGNGTGVESGNGTGTGTGTGNGTETAKKCPSDQHKEDDQCISNTRQCNNKIQNGTGLETWANGWGLCKVNGCDSGFAINGNSCLKKQLKCLSNQHEENGKCISNSRQCNNKIANGTGTETWINGWGICKVKSCDKGYIIDGNNCVKEPLKCKTTEHEENGKCVSNNRECKILNAEAEETWINNAWDICRVKSCDLGYQESSNQCLIKSTYPDKKTCKAVGYYSDAQKELRLSAKNWCANLKSRFKIKKKGNDFIYDAMLKGFWSKWNGKYYKLLEAMTHCKGLGNGYALPDIWKLISLTSPTKNVNYGYIHPLFTDTNKNWFWSSTSRAGLKSFAWGVHFGYGRVGSSDTNYRHQVRCFRSGRP